MEQDNIDAFPRKKLFIDILTQDVSVTTCILDLIDNSFDSYIRKKIEERRRIELTFDENHFEIFDDCGGIEKDFLRDSVFKFGSENRSIENPTLGMYGIGLKRSIFKLGNEISLETDDGNFYSYMSLNVPNWEKEEGIWTIPFEFESSRLKVGEKPYTRIKVMELHSEIKIKFGLDTFRNELLETIKKFYCILIRDNIDFFFNGDKVKPSELLVPISDEYEPSVHIEKYEDVDIEILCFIDPTKGTKKTNVVNERGWNLFCNNRLILANDITEVTGWIGGGDKSVLPKYHPTYNEFRGIVFLKSNNPFALPLNTSKSGLNKEHKTYQHVLNLMSKTARPVIDYLADKYTGDRTQEEEDDARTTPSESDSYMPTFKQATEIKTTSQFKAPKREELEARIKLSRISYYKEKELVAKMMRVLDVTTFKQVGEKTFEYYQEMEGITNE